MEESDKLSHSRYGMAVDMLSRKWTLHIIYILLTGPKRFREISSSIPNMSDKILGQRLRELEHEGIVQRRVYADIPVKVEYKLTHKGSRLESIIAEVHKWSEDFL